MNDNELKQLFAELIAAQGQALSIIISAISRQIDPARLTSDLKQYISAAKMLPSISPLAVRIATEAMAAAEAERAHQKKPGPQGG